MENSSLQVFGQKSWESREIIYALFGPFTLSPVRWIKTKKCPTPIVHFWNHFLESIIEFSIRSWSCGYDTRSLFTMLSDWHRFTIQKFTLLNNFWFWSVLYVYRFWKFGKHSFLICLYIFFYFGNISYNTSCSFWFKSLYFEVFLICKN